MEENGMSSADAKLVILENGQVRVCPLDQGRASLLGRFDPNGTSVPDILLSSKIISRKHGWIHYIEGQWYYVDHPRNLNNTFHNGTRIPRPLHGMKQLVPLEEGDVLRVDSGNPDRSDPQGISMLFTASPMQGNWEDIRLLQQTVLGGAEDCAMILQTEDGYFLTDCGHGAEIYLNGSVIGGSAHLRQKDCIRVDEQYYFFQDDRLLLLR